MKYENLNSQKGIVPIIAILVFAVIATGFGGVQYFKQQQAKQASKANIAEETVGWQTYHFNIQQIKETQGITLEAKQTIEKAIAGQKLENGSFEIKYPQTWFATTWPLHGALVPSGLFLTEKEFAIGADEGCVLQLAFDGNLNLKKDKYYPISVVEDKQGSQELEGCKKITGQILSTFKFTK